MQRNELVQTSDTFEAQCEDKNCDVPRGHDGDHSDGNECWPRETKATFEESPPEYTMPFTDGELALMRETPWAKTGGDHKACRLLATVANRDREIERLRAVLKDHPCGDRRCPAHD